MSHCNTHSPCSLKILLNHFPKALHHAEHRQPNYIRATVRGGMAVQGVTDDASEWPRV